MQNQRIEEFKNLCNEYVFTFTPVSELSKSVDILKNLIKEGLEIQNIQDFDIIDSCIKNRKGIKFIQTVVDSGAFVKNKHIENCYSKPEYIDNATAIISILENAKNIETSAVKNISKRNKGLMIRSFSMICFLFIFSIGAFIYDKKMDGFSIDNAFYIIIGIISIPFIILFSSTITRNKP